MKNDDLFYGLEHWEKLESSPDQVIELVLDDACNKVGEDFDVIADRITWPIKIFVYRRKSLGGDLHAEMIAQKAIEDALECLDEEYGNPDGDPSDPTDAIKEAAMGFGCAIVLDYRSWQCEPTGVVIECTREQAQAETL